MQYIKHIYLPFIIVLCLFFGKCNAIYGQGYFDYNSEVLLAYQDVIDLRFDAAKIRLSNLELNQPDNLSRLHIENYIDFLNIFINEDEEEYKQLKKKKKARIKAISKADDSSPYKLFVLGEINLQWAVANSKFGHQFSVLKDIYSAYRDLKENQKKFPEFEENKKSLSVIHAVNETIPIPGFIKSLFALEGSIERGEKEIIEMLDYAEKSNSMFYPEALSSYAVITLYQRNDKERAFEIIKNSSLDPATSPLVGFLFAKIAQRAGYNEEALAYLFSCPSGPEYKSFEYLNFLKGLGLIRKLDPTAKDYFLDYIQNFEGRLYIKEAYQKLAWIELMDNNLAGYKKYIAAVQKYGTSIVDDDKQAQKEAELGKIPNPEMLKARLLFDGGYYQRAYTTLITNGHRFEGNEVLQLEYLYRMGRATQALNNHRDAAIFFSKTIDKGTDSKEYYACNAALQMGTIYEAQSNYKQAEKYFNLCLSMSPEKYKSSLHLKAKAGLDRIRD